MRKDDHLIFEALINKLPGAGPDAALRNTGAGENAENAQQFTVVSGGVDNTSEEGIDINPADHIHAQSLKDAAEETLGEMQGDEDFNDTFPEGYREYVKDIFMMSNDSGDFIAILPGHLNEDQIFNKLIDVRDNSENAENADERKERTQRKWEMNKNRWAKWKAENPEAAAKHAAKKAGKSENAEHVPLTLGEPDPALKNTGPGENAENKPHGYPQGMTAIQNLVLNELKKRGFVLTKISHEDKERDKYPTVYMTKQSGPMHTVAEVDGMGSVNDKPYKEYLANLEDKSENAGNKPYTPSGARPDPEDPAYDTWQSIAQDHAGEDAEGRPVMQTYVHLDLYTGKTSVIPAGEFQQAIDGLEKVRGKMTVYKGEEYMVLVVPGK